MLYEFLKRHEAVINESFFLNKSTNQAQCLFKKIKTNYVMVITVTGIFLQQWFCNISNECLNLQFF